jgi:hypothetical protein
MKRADVLVEDVLDEIKRLSPARALVKDATPIGEVEVSMKKADVLAEDALVEGSAPIKDVEVSPIVASLSEGVCPMERDYALEEDDSGKDSSYQEDVLNDPNISLEETSSDFCNGCIRFVEFVGREVMNLPVA